MVRPAWATVVTSFPSVTRTLRIESTASRRAAATGIGPMPGISQISPGSRWPRTRARVVHPDVDHGGGTGGSPTAPGPPRHRRPPPAPLTRVRAVDRLDVDRPAGQTDQGVGGDRLQRLVETGPPRLAGQSARLGLDRGDQPGSLVGGQPGVETNGAVTVGPVAQIAAPADGVVGAVL